MKAITILFFLACLLPLFTQAQDKSKESEIVANFKMEAQKVVKHYEKDENSLKLKAAYFLLNNMYAHKTLLCDFWDEKGNVFQFNEANYETAEEADKALIEFKNAGGKYKIRRLNDIEFMNSEMIISNIENSFLAWQNSPWKASYNFETFCEFILPYRNITEPVEINWKKKYYEDYKHVILNADDPQDPVSVCTSFLKEIAYFEFLKKTINPQPALSIDQIHNRGKASCVDLANLAVLNGRALGLAVTYDFTPYHAASSNSHYWNTIIDKEGKHIPFNGNLDLPYLYDANYRRLGKVLRKTFSKAEEHITNYVKPKRIPERRLREKNVIDVTNEYVNTFDISYKFSGKVLDNISYLTVFNKGRWKATWWGKTNDLGNTIFKNMGSNIVYLPAQSIEKEREGKKVFELLLEKYPIQLSEEGNHKILKPNFKDTFSCSLTRDNEITGPYRDFNTVELIENQTFKLYCWDGDWKFLADSKVKNAVLDFDNLPKNALFRLLPEEEDGFERVFTIDFNNCKIHWF